MPNKAETKSLAINLKHVNPIGLVVLERDNSVSEHVVSGVGFRIAQGVRRFHYSAQVSKQKKGW